VTLLGGFDSSWNEIIDPHREWITDLLDKLEDSSDVGYLPSRELIFKALSVARNDVRAIILGQDPYHTKGMAEGLAFSVPRSLPMNKIPASLKNIFTEYQKDLGFTAPTTGHLGQWLDNGVLLLNGILTVAPGWPLSHKGKGWERVTDSILESLIDRKLPVIAWGKPAEQKAVRIGFKAVLASPHPSPLSAYRGFFGSQPFSRVNEILAMNGQAPIDWKLS
jgi:uracil-DNA glycosylase